jgi:GH15 family glucan-1,4-alpha-glucosidase
VNAGRVDGYAPIEDYAAIGDGRTVALVARDGSIDWLCVADLDSSSIFGAILDAERGGRFALAPEEPHTATRRYVALTNVLETTFETAGGAVRVTDALTLPGSELAPYRELVRHVEGLAGEVSLAWRVEPRFEYGAVQPKVVPRAGVPVVAHGGRALAVLSWDAGEADVRNDGTIGGRFLSTAGSASTIALSVADREPLVLPPRGHVLERLEATARWWQEWTAARRYEGPWREQVLRSLLALKLLVYSPSGAIAAAPTTSLPEQIGGVRNWDYRYSWPRDSALALEALLATGCTSEARAFFWWLLHASQLTHPRVRVLYRLSGRPEADEHPLELDGYRHSRPVRVGNGAAEQTQLDVYGELLVAATRLADAEQTLDRDHGRRLAGLADFVCAAWQEPDAGIWETRSPPRHFTQSKMMCAIALDRACELAARGLAPAAHLERWRAEQHRIRDFVESECYSEERQAYVRSAGDGDLDASLLVALNAGYDNPRSERLVRSVDAIRAELARGPFVRRSGGDDGVTGGEGAFLACSFWLVGAYARQGRLDEASELMDELVALANDVGLYSEEIDPDTGAFLGNFPQGLSHLSLVDAALAISGRELER